MDALGHGTEVAGILAADGGIKGKNLAYKVMPTLTASTSTLDVLSLGERTCPLKTEPSEMEQT